MRRRGSIHCAVLAILGALLRPAAGADCNGNGSDDALDIARVNPGFGGDRWACLDAPPIALAAADFDLDGDIDLAVAIPFAITILLNDGEGDLLPGAEIPIGSLPLNVIAADLDLDGDVDLATANGGGRLPDGTALDANVSIVLNRGDGSFDSPRNHGVGKDPTPIAAADLDGDNDLDLAVANVISSDVSILFNTGQGAFGPHARVPLGSGVNPQRIAAGDLDGDGDSDLVTIQEGAPEEVILLLNDGRGSFQESRGIELSEVLAFPAALATSDADGDGDLDLFVAGLDREGDRVLLLRNKGRGDFDVLTLPFMGGGLPLELAVADLDGDGDPDFAIAQSEGLRIHLNDRGLFAEAARTSLRGLKLSLLAVDMNRDAVPDLVSTDLENQSINITSNLGTGKLVGTIEVPVAEPEEVLVADLDRDGHADLVARGDPVGVWFNHGGGSFPSIDWYPTESTPHKLMAPDIDGDGDLDVALTTSRGLLVLENAGDRRVKPPLTYAAGDELTLAVPADLDGDGDADVAAVAPGLLGVLVLSNLGTGEFEKEPPVLTPNVESALDIIAADIDGDGDNDLVLPNRGVWNGLANVEAHVAILRNHGGGFEASLRPLDSVPLATTSGDLDGDGLLDVVLSLAGCQDCSPLLEPSTLVLLNGGNGSYREERRFFTRSQPLWVLAEDLEGDGAPDVVMSFQDAGEVAVLLNPGGAAFDPPAVHSIGAPAISLAALDADRDGDLDLAASTAASGETAACRPSGAGALSLLANDGRGGLGPPLVEQTAEALFSLTPADIDGNTLPDLVARGARSLVVLRNTTRPPASLDANGNLVPDECEGLFRRGDAGGDGVLDITDPILLLSHLHRGGPEPGCLDAADADDSGRLDLTDAVVILEYLFRGGPAPPPPGHAAAACGPDPVGEADSLGCDEYPPCG